MRIKHSKTISEPGDLDCSDYNSDHEIADPIELSDLNNVKLLGYTLVEEKNLSAGTTTCTFSDLNGDEDEEYLIEHELIFENVSGDHILSIFPNNDGGGSYYRNAFGVVNGGSSIGGASDSCITYQVSSTVTISHGKCIIYPKTGVKRQFISEISMYYGTTTKFTTHQITWNNTSSNITSLVLTIASGCSFSGIIRLWKKISISEVV